MSENFEHDENQAWVEDESRHEEKADERCQEGKGDDKVEGKGLKAGEQDPDDKKRQSPGDHFSSTYELKADQAYESKGYQYETDSAGRITHCEGELRLEDGGRNPNHQVRAGGPDREIHDHGGHLIASRFGGSERLDNIVAMDGKLNQREYKNMEEEFAGSLQEGKSVYVDINVEYESSSKRPEALFVEAQTTDRDGRSDHSIYIFENNTGDSTGDRYQLEEEEKV